MKRRRRYGFTLIELMVVVAVIAILAAVALTSYSRQVRKSGRAEARQGLAEIAARQEKWRSNHPSYIGTDSSAADKTAFGAMPVETRYTIAITAVAAANAWTATATPSTTDQLKDSCSTLTFDYLNGAISKLPTTGDCW